MPRKIPVEIRKKILPVVYELADAHRYLTSDKKRNSAFMDQLVRDPRVGGEIQPFVSRSEMKTYIKDSLLNRYSKDRRVLPRNIDSQLQSQYGEIDGELEYVKKDSLSLHRAVRGHLVVAARTGFLKWETGLRKLLLYVAKAPNLPPEDGTPLSMALVIFQGTGEINSGDQLVTENALAQAGVECIWP
jgi:hypothetical protein